MNFDTCWNHCVLNLPTEALERCLEFFESSLERLHYLLEWSCPCNWAAFAGAAVGRIRKEGSLAQLSAHSMVAAIGWKDEVWQWARSRLSTSRCSSLLPEHWGAVCSPGWIHFSVSETAKGLLGQTYTLGSSLRLFALQNFHIMLHLLGKRGRLTGLECLIKLWVLLNILLEKFVYHSSTLSCLLSCSRLAFDSH